MPPQQYNKIRTERLDDNGKVVETTFEYVPVERVAAMVKELGDRLRKVAQQGVYVRVSPQTWERYDPKKHDK